MPTVATYIAVAVSFWSTHGLPNAQAPTWSWGTGNCAAPAAALQSAAGCGARGQISLDRFTWDHEDRASKCVAVVHEVGHANGLPHEPGTVMDPVFPYAWVPGACLGPPIYRCLIPNPFVDHQDGAKPNCAAARKARR